MRRINDPEVIQTFDRSGLRRRYAPMGKKALSYPQLKVWEKVAGVISPSRPGKHYSHDDVCSLDLLWIAIRLVRLKLKEYEKEVIDTGWGLDRWMQSKWVGKTLYQYLEGLPRRIRQHEVVASVISRLEKSQYKEAA